MKVGIIGISNNLAFRENLSAKDRSSLCEKSISFPPYDAGELWAVLRQRADTAFHDGALADDVIPPSVQLRRAGCWRRAKGA